MGDAIPKTMPRSTLACPPAKNFTDQYLKSTQNSQPQLLSSKPSTAVFEKASKKESEKDLALKPLGKEAPKTDSNFGSTGTGFRASSKDIKLNPKATLTNEPSSSTKKGILTDYKETKEQVHSEIHVKKWVDYSTKYGLGYLLSDGSTGVYFNDSTKIIMDKNGENFEYI